MKDTLANSAMQLLITGSISFQISRPVFNRYYELWNMYVKKEILTKAELIESLPPF
jgi:hypothetical protein